MPGQAAGASGRSVLLRNVFGRGLATGTEQKFRALLLEHLVRLLGCEVEAVLVHDSLGVLDPLLPRLLRDVVVNPLSPSVIEGLERQTRERVAQLPALYHSPHDVS